jgi:hypothetical protein
MRRALRQRPESGSICEAKATSEPSAIGHTAKKIHNEVMISDVCDEIADHTVPARISPIRDKPVVLIAKITCRGRYFRHLNVPVTGGPIKQVTG